MKKFQKIAAAVALAACTVSTAMAQDAKEDFYPHNFITVQGGAQVTFTDYNFTDLITPQFALSAGRYLTPELGVRLHVQGYEIKGGFDDLPAEPSYKFKNITGDLDVLFNMSNILYPHRTSQGWNWVLLAGFGVNHSWDYGQYNEIVGSKHDPAQPHYNNLLFSSTRRGTFNGRFGTQIERNFSRNFAVNLEVDANYKNDMFNLKVNDHVDWQVAAFLGLTYKFGMKKKAEPQPQPAAVIQEVVEEQAAPVAPAKPVVAEQPKPQPVAKPEPLKETFFYNIRLSDPDPETILNKIADWCKKYPEKGITISGYADKGTGNARINAKYAADRADKVAKSLQQKGVSASRMTVNSFGDTVQPFDENDRNRCVIVVGE